MSRRWKDTSELAAAMRARADQGRDVVLSPNTARLIAMAIDRPSYRASNSLWEINLYEVGSCIYRLDGEGGIDRVDAWARSTLIAEAAFRASLDAYPKYRFEQRRRGWVERS